MSARTPAELVNPNLFWTRGGVVVVEPIAGRPVAYVQAGRVRPALEAIQIATRIDRYPADYLGAATELGVAGILDLRGLWPSGSTVVESEERGERCCALATS